MSYPGYDMFDYEYVAPRDRVETLPEGQYPFRIIQAVPKTSKSGNKMLELKVSVTDNSGRDWHIYEYLIATTGDDAGMKRLNTKIGNIAKAINNAAIDTAGYDKRNLVQDLLGSNGKCYVKIQEDKTGQYPDKNVISKWLPYEDIATRDTAINQLDDDLVF